MNELEKGSFSKEPLTGEWPEPIRLVSWNVNRGLRLTEIIEFLTASSADLILLQEADVNARRTRYLNVPREIAEALKMNYVFGREFEELGQGNCICPAFHGQTTLSRFPLSNPRILRFRRQSRFWQPRWFIPRLQTFQRRLGARMALICEISIQGRTMVVYNAHLESRGNDELRYSQLSEMLGEAESNSGKTHVIVAGDLNFNISQGSAASLIAGMQLDSPFARLAGKKTARVRGHARSAAIDWILTDKTLCTSGPEIHDLVCASDHFPLSLEICMKGDHC
jgi:endonuclease/exonuclease/phosphatase family metal-dependent hydrolase